MVLIFLKLPPTGFAGSTGIQSDIFGVGLRQNWNEEEHGSRRIGMKMKLGSHKNGNEEETGSRRMGMKRKLGIQENGNEEEARNPEELE